MRPLGIAVVVTLAVAFVGRAVARAPQADPPIVLAMSDVARLGIHGAALKPARYTQRVHGYAVVTDLGALVAIFRSLARAVLCCWDREWQL